MNFKRNANTFYCLGALVLILLVFVIGLVYYLLSNKNPGPNGVPQQPITNGVLPFSDKQYQNKRPPPRPPQNPEQRKGIMKQPPPTLPPPPPPSDVETPIGDGTGALVLFYSERCGHSVNMMPDWEKMKNILGSTNKVDIIGLEQSKNPEIQQYDIKGFPTIRFYPDGFPSSNFVEYRGPRTAESFIKFVQSRGQEV